MSRARIAIRTALALAFAVANVCSIRLSASATIARFESAKVPADVAPNAVPMLEIVSVAAAIGMVVAAGWVLRAWSIALVSLVMTVTAIAGFDRYGWIGLVAPIMIQGTAHALDFTFRDRLRIGRGAERQTDEQPFDPIERARQIDARSQAERTDWFGRGLAVLAEVALSQREVMRVFRDDPHVRVGSGRALTLIRAARKGAEKAEEVAS